VLNVWEHNVYDWHSNGGWWGRIDCQGGCMEIAASVNNTLYILQDPYAPEDGAPYAHEYWNEWPFGGQWEPVTEGLPFEVINGNQFNQISNGQLAFHISAGTDAWGYSTVDYLTANSANSAGIYNAYQWRARDNQYTPIASNITDICAGTGLDFSVSWDSRLYAIWGNAFWQIGSNVRHDAYWW
jgi:hypothetical protein